MRRSCAALSFTGEKSFRRSARCWPEATAIGLHSLTFCFAAQIFQCGLTAEGHDRNLSRPEVGQHHLRGRAFALQQRYVAWLGATRRQIECYPGARLRVVAHHTVGAPEGGPGPVLLIHM